MTFTLVVFPAKRIKQWFSHRPEVCQGGLLEAFSEHQVDGAPKSKSPIQSTLALSSSDLRRAAIPQHLYARHA